MEFEIVSPISNVEIIAVRFGIDVLARLMRDYGHGRWRKLKGIATVRLPTGRLRIAEIHWTRPTALANETSRSNAISTESPDHARFVVCVRNDGHEASLDLRKLYELVPDADAEQDGMIRIIDESGEDYLYPASMFVSAPLPHAVEEAVLRATRA
jgi:hypothetical protein